MGSGWEVGNAGMVALQRLWISKDNDHILELERDHCGHCMQGSLKTLALEYKYILNNYIQ